MEVRVEAKSTPHVDMEIGAVYSRTNCYGTPEFGLLVQLDNCDFVMVNLQTGETIEEFDGFEDDETEVEEALQDGWVLRKDVILQQR